MISSGSPPLPLAPAPFLQHQHHCRQGESRGEECLVLLSSSNISGMKLPKCAVFAIPLGKRLLFSEAFMDHLLDNCRKSWIFYSVLLQQKEEYKREFIGNKYRRDPLRMGILNSIWIPQTSLKSYHRCHSSLQLSWENLLSCNRFLQQEKQTK